jgi:hypothetical protein
MDRFFYVRPVDRSDESGISGDIIVDCTAVFARKLAPIGCHVLTDWH